MGRGIGRPWYQWWLRSAHPGRWRHAVLRCCCGTCRKSGERKLLGGAQRPEPQRLRARLTGLRSQQPGVGGSPDPETTVPPAGKPPSALLTRPPSTVIRRSSQTQPQTVQATCSCNCTQITSELALNAQQRFELRAHFVDYLARHGCDSLAPPFSPIGTLDVIR